MATSNIRPAVLDLVALGPMPEDVDATETDVERYVELLDSIETPVTDDEAIVLVSVFGPDDFFGVAFSVRHLVETAPGWPIWTCLDGDGPWIEDLRIRARNSGFSPP